MWRRSGYKQRRQGQQRGARSAPCAAAPYGCSWNTTSYTDGTYDLRAILTDRNGKDTISATVAARRVDNSPLRAADIRTTNGGAIQARLETGDSMSFVYSQQVNPATVTPGWAGAF